MAGKSRRAEPTLRKILFDEGYRFDFFQAVRLLEQLYPERQPVGTTGDPAKEVVRFHSRASLSFPPGSIYEIADNDDSPVDMTVAFIGLTGPAGVLPRHYTELLIERLRDKDSALAGFLDIFNHRLISLFYRAWEKYRACISFEKGGKDRFTWCLQNLIGLGTPGLQNRLKIEDRQLLLYTGLIARRPHSVSALENFLQDYFQVPIKVEQFKGQWFDLDESSRSSLGSAGLNNQLGITTVVGESVWDQQSKFRIQVGPVEFDKFVEFLPQGEAFELLSQLVKFYAGEEFDFDVQLILKAGDVPQCRLEDNGQATPQLGWSTWVASNEFSNDVDDVVLAVN